MTVLFCELTNRIASACCVVQRSVGVVRIIVSLALVTGAVGCHNFKALPDGVSYAGRQAPATDVALFVDNAWLDHNDRRHLDQTIFDEVFRLIAEAYDFILLDMFLYNDFQGPTPESTRALAEELTDALVAKKFSRPEMDIVVITDPVNVLYGGQPSVHFERLRHAGVRVVVTDLLKLRDSNPLYSFFWRIFAKPFGNAPAATLSNPIGPGRVSIRTYLELLNFKANHRKVLVVDNGDQHVGLVSSANPHDGSSAHRNAAVRFTGAAVGDLLATENAVLVFSGHEPVDRYIGKTALQSGVAVQVVTEGKIKQAVLSRLDGAGPGFQIDLMMFYLSDRKIVAAIERAHKRGARVRLLLDPNKDAFGREKNGIPNRSVGYELNTAGVPVRWCGSRGEQCHVKMMIVHDDNGASVIITGSANFTRRNLTDYNLETDVVVSGQRSEKVFRDASEFFETSWRNAEDRTYSLAFAAYEDGSWWRRLLYLFMEWSGFATF